MRVLLIYALNKVAQNRFESHAEDSGYKELFAYPPLSIAHLGAVLEKNGIEVELTDDSIHTEDEIKEAVTRCDVVGISAMSPNAQRALFWAEIARKENKTVIAGGAHATSVPDFFLENDSVDVLVIGEGEETLLELLDNLGNRDKYEEIRGIGFRKNGSVVLTPSRPLITDLDALPYPAWHLLPVDRYFAHQDQIRTMYLFSSRGCPWNCRFCNKKMSTRKYRCRSAENVVDELESVIETYTIDYAYYLDDLFTGNRKRVVKICEEILRRNIRVKWSCVTRVNVVDYKLLKLMRKAGCMKIEYGVESGSQEELDRMNKSFTADQIIRASRATSRAGILVKFFLMIGYPGQTLEDLKRTREMLRKARPDRAGFMIFNPYPGCEVYEEMKDRVTVKDYSDLHPVFRGSVFEHENFTTEELKKHREQMYADYMQFYNSLGMKLRRGLMKVYRFLSRMV